MFAKKVKDNTFIFMKKSTGEKIVHGITFMIFFLYAITLLFPLIWLAIQSLFSPAEYDLAYQFRNQGIFTMPTTWKFSNYITAFENLRDGDWNFIGMMFNSLWYILLAETWCLIWPVMTGYIFAKYDFKGKALFHAVIIFTLTVPVAGTTGAMYKLVGALGIYNKGPLFVIVTGIGGFSSSFLVYYGIFKGISWNYAEAVFIDGGGNNTAFFQVILPQAMPAISAMMVSALITYWNEYYQFLLYLPDWPTVATGLYKVNMQKNSEGSRPPYRFAGQVISIIPVLIIYGIMADRMMKNLSIGGLKG